jgi:hypothetical protein
MLKCTTDSCPIDGRRQMFLSPPARTCGQTPSATLFQRENACGNRLLNNNGLSPMGIDRGDVQ